MACCSVLQQAIFVIISEMILEKSEKTGGFF